MNDSGIVDLLPSQLREQWETEGLYPNLSVFDAFFQQVVKNPHSPAVSSLTETVSYEELLGHSLRLAQGLSELGIGPGDVLAYQLPNHWRNCALDLAAAALGAIVAPFPPGRGKADIESLLRRSQAKAVVVQHSPSKDGPCSIIDSLQSGLPALQIQIALFPQYPRDHRTLKGWHNLDRLLEASVINRNALPNVDPNSPARLLVSSGTESEPKLVAYSHNAMLGGRGRFLQNIHGKGHSFRGLYLVPLGSAFGSTATFGILSWLGGSIVLLDKFDVEDAIQAIATLKPSYILGVPAMFQRIAAHEKLAEVDKFSLISLISGGAVIDRATIERCMEAFGCRFLNLYGSADGVNCHNVLEDDIESIYTSVGRPIPQICDIRIVDENGVEVPHGEVGEIKARGPLSPMQYVNAPELDEKYRNPEGWVFTGDLGYINANGYLILSGRKKDIIIRGGQNISPVQVEKFATAHPDVVSAACVPVPDSELEQRVCLCLTLRTGARKISLAELSQYLKEQGLEINKHPEYLRYYSQLPLSPAGKVDKQQLKAEVACL